jgi:hypothetical protein
MDYLVRNYLNSINKNSSLNYNAFIKKCSSYSISENTVKECFVIKKDSSKKGNFYYLTIKDNSSFSRIFDKFNIEKENKKVQLSLHGNSKKAKSDNSFLLVKLNAHDIVPWSVVVDKTSFYSNTNDFKKKLIVIENEDNFWNIIDSFKNEDLNLDEFNFILGFGNYISDNKFTVFFDLYDEILCYLDIDIGGLKTFSSLDKNITKNISFYFSEHMNKYLNEFGKTITENDYIEVSKYTSNPKLLKVTSAILKSKKFAEQEIFQH